MRSLASEWERQRKSDVVLELVPLRDDLAWLLAGEPDPGISVNFFVLCAEETNATNLKRYLLEFSKDYPATFQLSGWVDAFIGRIILNDKDLGRAFIKEYWKQRRPAVSRTRAYRALALIEGKHRGHWLNATSWMQSFRKRSHPEEEKDAFFIKRALGKYLDRADCVRCACLPDELLKTIAATVLCYSPDASRSEVYVDALAKSFRISSSTLTHVRASIKKQAFR
jgi:hypothetical protein